MEVVSQRFGHIVQDLYLFEGEARGAELIQRGQPINPESSLMDLGYKGDNLDVVSHIPPHFFHHSRILTTGGLTRCVMLT